ncbi:MAG: hypothetical protein ACEQSK_04305 [Sphingomonadaceae bacterium]
MKLSALLAAILAVSPLLLASTAHAQDLGRKDGVLATASGHTVYTFDKDVAASGKSVCNGPCADNWPPVPAPASVGAPYSVVTRDDGSRQLAYQGKPLYTFVKDGQPGQRNGDNVKDVWHVVKD